MRIRDWFRKDIVNGTKVFVCAFGTQFDEVACQDAKVYANHYSSTKLLKVSRVVELNDAIRSEPDVIHLHCDFSATGVLADEIGGALTGTGLIQACCESGVKLLWVASENSPDIYVKNFAARGKRINLVMTVTRDGKVFPEFLDKLLSRMRFGETMPSAWARLVPQLSAQSQPDAPGCIFFAGRGGVVLR